MKVPTGEGEVEFGETEDFLFGFWDDVGERLTREQVIAAHRLLDSAARQLYGFPVGSTGWSEEGC